MTARGRSTHRFRIESTCLSVGLLAACSGDLVEPLAHESGTREQSFEPERAEEEMQATDQAAGPRHPSETPDQREARREMVTEQIAARGVRDERVLDAMRRVPRHEFVPAVERSLSYQDEPLPIGYAQTISQPYIVALMTELLGLEPSDRVLEIGTGSGYQAAILAELVSEVDTIEIVEPLAERAQSDLARLGYDNVHVRAGDGYQGWPERAPFDGIIVTAAAPSIPKPLLEQLKVGAHLVIPVGDADQDLLVVTRTESGFDERTEVPVRFVPMTGRARSE